MARHKGIPGVSFSWKRATGISAGKSRASHALGVPLSRSGRQRKFGKAAGCVVPLLLTVAAAGGLGWSSLSWGSGETVIGRASVLDGDTIEIRGEHIRLHGIDAPEGGQPCTDAKGKTYRCGQRAAFALADKIKDEPPL